MLRTVFRAFILMMLGGSPPAFADDVDNLLEEYWEASATLGAISARIDVSCGRIEEVKRLTETEDPEIKAICMAEIQTLVRAEQANGLSRREIMPIISRPLIECQDSARGATLQDVIDAQNQCLSDHADFNSQYELTQQAFAAYDTEAQRVISFIEDVSELRAERARLQAEIARLRASSAAMLAEAERILQNLARQ